MPATKRSNRKEQILQSLAQMLETSPGQRITTAKLATEVGVSEAALYRHFPSKARMFEGLIEFIEDTLLSRINLILENEKETRSRIYNILTLLLTFAEKNPGITRILTGDALQGEQERLRERVQSLFEKLETQFKQVLRERKLREGKAFTSEESVLANFFLAFVEGKMNQFVRSDFKAKPTAQFDKQWVELEKIWL
ncbi:nucleoid occlusion factor SlmA [Pseudoalteromonas sp. McH1-7]|uniref:Nucleoid occlusion factor SlmA n=1 Tax=Pseudoalteromonas peptidolytica F12-50-A1 TaxID=1315280 RepID=A0A8I0MSG9_9GAMM|nr:MULTISPECIES: nucleoid occlusion factor SlmA [Pseudoalteromonas]MBE0344979.1 TetR/AcrR family transcriptional regulator [Pseudoalteromonas peptidolytica F12-50-A1]MDW7550424.1 nucleoid occlusion factor SlmA [Pseudoalteromonas peptidolytica]NLR15587.1 nucleoid occlusion factor SlmA [Pseudoalteromonas peptidolytica]NUZ11860.1 nucleoid occlusion factor SlmA [Pseudoalteromonas sp. McH1-7]RRS09878.1 nucleoid occlusion factor SlmA [Pseudoalteromonas sp. J010]